MKLYKKIKNSFKNDNKIKRLINKNLLYKMPTKICSGVLLTGICSLNTLPAKAMLSIDEIINCEYIKNIAESNDMRTEDVSYILRALNLYDPFIYLSTDLAKNFRFFDGDKEKIEIGKLDEEANTDTQWLYNRDSGKGSPNVTRCLFPSSSGDLNSTAGFNRMNNFTLDCGENLTPKLIAEIASVCYKFRNDSNFKEACLALTNYFGLKSVVTTQELSKFIADSTNIEKMFVEDKMENCEKTVKNIDRKIENCDIIKNKMKNYEETEETKENIENSEELLKILGIEEEKIKEFEEIISNEDVKIEETNRQNQKKKLANNKIPRFANFMKLVNKKREKYNNGKEIFIKKWNFSTFLSNFSSQKFNLEDPECIKRLSTILHLCLNMFRMIDKQEKSSKEDDSKILPKYAAEKMLMTYFVKQFNEKSEIENFYKEVSSLIKNTSLFEIEEFEEEKNRYRILTKLLNEFKGNKKNPYQNDLQSNSEAHKLFLLPGERCKFSDDEKNVFQDCADIAMRHLITLLFYSQTQNFDRITLSNQEKNAYCELLTTIERTLKIRNFDTVLNYPQFKDRIKMFLYYLQQNENKNVDNATIVSRSIWNYVVSNVNIEKKGEIIYPLVYVKDGNELEPGLLNSLKFIYNVAYALKDDLGINQTQLESVKNELDNLIQTVRINTQKLNCLQIEDCIKNVYGLINNGITKVETKKRTNISFISEEDPEKRDISFHFDVEIIDKTKPVDPSPLLFSAFYTSKHSQLICSPITKDENGEIRSLALEDKQGLGIIFYNKKIGETALEEIPAFVDIYSDLLFDFTEKYSNCSKIFKEYFKKHNFFKKVQSVFDMDSISGKDYNIFFEFAHDFFKKEKKFEIINQKSKTDLLEFLKHKMKTAWEIHYTHSIKNSLDKFAYDEATIEGFESILSDNYKNDNKKRTIESRSFVFSDLETYTIFKSVEELEIMPRAFSDCKLTTLNIPKNVKKIEFHQEAFSESNIKTVTFPENMENLEISQETFKNSNIENIVLPKNLKTLNIRKGAFANCKNLKNIILPESLENLHIENYAFLNCENLEKIKWPDKGIKFLESSFCDIENSKLTICNIDRTAFIKTPKLSKTGWPDSIRRLPDSVKFEGVITSYDPYLDYLNNTSPFGRLSTPPILPRVVFRELPPHPPVLPPHPPAVLTTHLPPVLPTHLPEEGNPLGIRTVPAPISPLPPPPVIANHT